MLLIFNFRKPMLLIFQPTTFYLLQFAMLYSTSDYAPCTAARIGTSLYAYFEW